MSECATVDEDSYLYVMGGPSGPLKVGTSRFPATRLRTLQVRRAERLSIIYTICVTLSLARKAERRAHDLLATRRVHGEWFGVDAETAIRAVRQAIIEAEPKRVLPAGSAGSGSVAKVFSFTAELANKIADYRFDNRISTDSDAIRQLVEAGLDAKPQTKKPRR